MAIGLSPRPVDVRSESKDFSRFLSEASFAERTVHHRAQQLYARGVWSVREQRHSFNTSCSSAAASWILPRLSPNLVLDSTLANHLLQLFRTSSFRPRSYSIRHIESTMLVEGRGKQRWLAGLSPKTKLCPPFALLHRSLTRTSKSENSIQTRKMTLRSRVWLRPNAVSKGYGH